MPSKRGKSSGEPPEILQHLGRAALAYGISRLARQESSKSGDKSSTQSATPKKRKHGSSPSSSSKSKSHHTSSRSKDMQDKSDDNSTASSHRSSRSHSRKRSSKSRASAGAGVDNNELHHHMSQLAAGVLAFGVQRYMHHRHERKRQKAAAPSGAADPRGSRGPQQPARGIFDAGGAGKPRVDPELSAALASLDGELQGTAQELGRLARKKPDHRDCEVHRGLVDSEQRIQRGLDGLRSSVNNVRNLHPGVEGPERTVPMAAATGRKREERARKREAEARIREAEARSREAELRNREGRVKGERMPAPPPPERDGARRGREKPSWDTGERYDGYERRSRARDDWGGFGARGEGRWMR
ncbi:hypothetical protein B0T18DRAFT_335 [Schizothecium vesticola]|uniref:Uncharacterized protein n=1 Tax=Schizothecium vesticola TaxID=314040 RepID=A0AA40F7K9_9PEZI|nr:hypothetical protein B0T18DRAFT_335 [Schizothecium vesticola]